jgi:hypothetical protein
MAPTGDQNPLKDSADSNQKLERYKKTNQTPKKSPKTLEVSPVWSPVLLAGKPPYGYTRVYNVGRSITV